jgi:hypothetical protein
MTKISCSICGATAWPDDPAIRATFELRYFGADGAPTSGGRTGEWRCEEHRPPRTRASRPAIASPIEAVAELERLIDAMTARLQEELIDDDDPEVDNSYYIDAVLKGYRAEIARGIAALKKTLTPEPVKAKACPKPSPFVRRKGQLDLIEAEAAFPGEPTEAAP